MQSWYEVNNKDQILSPALLFYPDRIKKNIDRMIEIAGSAQRLRPHVKTYKCAEIVDMQLAAGISKFKCATPVEAEMLGNAGAKDVLISYALIGPAQKKYIDLCSDFPNTTFSVLVDHSTQLKEWRKLSDLPIRVYIDIDVGMERTGIKAEQAIRLYDEICQKGFDFQGLQIYDGNVHNVNPTERKEVVDRDYKSVEVLINHIKSKTNKPFELVCGGSITFPIHAMYPERNLSPGTTLLWDQGYTTKFPDVDFDIAAVLLTRIISKPGKNKICVDLGHKAVGSEMSDLRVYFPQIPSAKRLIHSEEHLTLEIENIDDWEIGDVLYGIPWHICPTVALHEKAGIIENGRCEKFWDIAARKRYYEL